jgi:hypothetical protein
MPLVAEKINERIISRGTLDVQQNLTPDERCRAHSFSMAYGDYAKGFRAEEWILPISVPSDRRCRAHCLYMAYGDYSKESKLEKWM